MEPILEVSHVSKKFRISNTVEPYLSIRSQLNFFSRPKLKTEDFWALRDINFSLQTGDSLGIVGKNGAGKSTLLKILSKITPPTEGRIVGRGRVASLLEVGTGFHPELTGRENIFLNGSILGMKNKEIIRQFDAIVEFSGTEKFLDTQLKFFSSGMQLRLAFSVAAFLEPEILIIDEVLAVGDAEFQKKCMGKMTEVSNSGRTILFVSHNLAAVSRLCNVAMLLDNGCVASWGSPTEVINKYLQTSDASATKKTEFKLSDKVSLTELKLDTDQIVSGGPLSISFTLSSTELNPVSGIALLVYNEMNERVGIVDLRSEKLFKESQSQQTLDFSVQIHKMGIVEGEFSLGLFVSSNLCQGDFYDLQKFHVKMPDTDILPYEKQYRGYVAFDHHMDIRGR